MILQTIIKILAKKQSLNATFVVQSFYKSYILNGINLSILELHFGGWLLKTPNAPHMHKKIQMLATKHTLG